MSIEPVIYETAPRPFSARVALKAAMVAIFLTEGFTALRRANAEIEAEIARENRVRLAREGWIA